MLSSECWPVHLIVAYYPAFQLYANMMNGTLYTNSRLENWLDGLPNPISPQERYLQGLDSRVDHPLHPHPLKSVRGYQNLKSRKNEIALISQTLQPESGDQDLEGHDTTETRQSVMFDVDSSVIVCKKRTHSRVSLHKQFSHEKETWK